MPKSNCKCRVCGTEYYFCPNCSASRGNAQPKWHINYCSENCKTIFDTVVSFNCGHLEKNEANAILKDCDVKMYLYNEGLQESIKKIRKKDFVKYEAEDKKNETTDNE